MKIKIKIKIILATFFFIGVFLAIEKAQASTSVYTVNFATTIEGFSYVNESCTGTCTQGFTAADGNPAGSIFARLVGKNKRSAGYFSKSLTWENMGVPAGAIVTQVDGSFDVKLAQETHAATNVAGLKLYDATDTSIILEGGVDLETEFDPTSASWITRNADGVKNVISSYQASDTMVTIRMRTDVRSGNNNSATTEVRSDKLVFTITYNMPPTLSISQPDGTGDAVNLGDIYNLTYSLNDDDEIVTSSFYFDTDNAGLDGTAISGACASAVEGSGVTCAWDTNGMSPGNYYVYGITSDGVNPQVSAYSSGQITINSGGSLSVDIVDSGGASVASPAVLFASKTFDWIAQTSSGTLGISSQKIRVNNTTAAPSWVVSIAATSGSTALWQSGGNNYDFNGSSVNGRLRVDASSATITPQGGCAVTGLTKGSATYFVQGSQDSINLITAGGSAQTNCYWDITGIVLTQDIPAGQISGSYSIGMTLTAT